jgi:hypothetical protein
MFLSLVANLPRRSSAEGGMITETEKVIITLTAKSNLKTQGTQCEQKAYFCHQIQVVAARKVQEISQINI